MRSGIGILALALALGCALAATAEAQTKANQLFGAKRSASAQPAMPVGAHAKGCLAGGVQLPESGPTWQAMRLSRGRNWGHPDTIAFIERLGARARDLGWPGIYVGDIAQPRGGPMTSGHASHQSGLDVDIWMLPPTRLNLSRAERENISSVSVRTEDQKGVTRHWTPTHMEVLRAAAEDRAVDRIFVAAAVKIEMCRAATGDRRWLQKIRPFFGHNTHFHVRLKCPRGARLCTDQTPTVAELSKGGDGCDETLMWWVTDYLEELKKPPDPNAPRRRGARDYTMDDLPAECAAVLSSD